MKISAASRRALNRLKSAAADEAFAGSYHPDHAALVEDELERAEAAMERRIAKLEGRQ